MWFLPLAQTAAMPLWSGIRPLRGSDGCHTDLRIVTDGVPVPDPSARLLG